MKIYCTMYVHTSYHLRHVLGFLLRTACTRYELGGYRVSVRVASTQAEAAIKYSYSYS